jgi:hypothetical protein
MQAMRSTKRHNNPRTCALIEAAQPAAQTTQPSSFPSSSARIARSKSNKAQASASLPLQSLTIQNKRPLPETGAENKSDTEKRY